MAYDEFFAALSAQFYQRFSLRRIDRKMILSVGPPEKRGPLSFSPRGKPLCAKTCLSRDAARGPGALGGFGLPPPCVAPQVSSIPFIGKCAIRTLHSTSTVRRAASPGEIAARRFATVFSESQREKSRDNRRATRGLSVPSLLSRRHRR